MKTNSSPATPLLSTQLPQGTNPSAKTQANRSARTKPGSDALPLPAGGKNNVNECLLEEGGMPGQSSSNYFAWALKAGGAAAALTIGGVVVAHAVRARTGGGQTDIAIGNSLPQLGNSHNNSNSSTFPQDKVLAHTTDAPMKNLPPVEELNKMLVNSTSEEIKKFPFHNYSAEDISKIKFWELDQEQQEALSFHNMTKEQVGAIQRGPAGVKWKKNTEVCPYFGIPIKETGTAKQMVAVLQLVDGGKGLDSRYIQENIDGLLSRVCVRGFPASSNITESSQLTEETPKEWLKEAYKKSATFRLVINAFASQGFPRLESSHLQKNESCAASSEGQKRPYQFGTLPPLEASFCASTVPMAQNAACNSMSEDPSPATPAWNRVKETRAFPHSNPEHIQFIADNSTGSSFPTENTVYVYASKEDLIIPDPHKAESNVSIPSKAILIHEFMHSLLTPLQVAKDDDTSRANSNLDSVGNRSDSPVDKLSVSRDPAVDPVAALSERGPIIVLANLVASEMNEPLDPRSVYAQPNAFFNNPDSSKIPPIVNPIKSSITYGNKAQDHFIYKSMEDKIYSQKDDLSRELKTLNKRMKMSSGNKIEELQKKEEELHSRLDALEEFHAALLIKMGNPPPYPQPQTQTLDANKLLRDQGYQLLNG